MGLNTNRLKVYGCKRFWKVVSANHLASLQPLLLFLPEASDTKNKSSAQSEKAWLLAQLDSKPHSICWQQLELDGLFNKLSL